MKKAFPLFLGLVSCAVLSCRSTGESGSTTDTGLLSTTLVQNANTPTGVDSATLSKMPTILFADTVHDFGTIREGEQVVYDFQFQNTGKVPLLVTGTQTSCGCTASDYPREPIAPGGSGAIKVKFDSKAKTGLQDKSIDVSTNAMYTPKLHIKGTVEGAK